MSEEYMEGGAEPEQPYNEGAGNSYDNEWVKFLSLLSDDESLSTLVSYIQSIQLTDKAKEKLRIYVSTLLDKEFATSMILDRNDYMRLMDDKNLIDADLYMGLTRFDITPEFQHIINLIRIKFGIKIRRSFRGFERKAIFTHRGENVNEERIASENIGKKSLGDKIRSTFKGE